MPVKPAPKPASSPPTYVIPKGHSNNKKPWVVKQFAYLNKINNTLTPYQKSSNSELTKICKKYERQTDKGPTGPYYIKHSYTEIYNDLLRYYKDKPINFLEIGVRQGGSLLMWKEFFPKATVYGIDIDPKSLEVDLKSRGIHYIIGNAYDPETIKKHFSNIKFDIVIDDGSHQIVDQQKCLQLYGNDAVLNKDGILIIEDISSIRDAKSIVHSFKGRINKCSIMDRTHCIPSLDDIFVIYYNT